MRFYSRYHIVLDFGSILGLFSPYVEMPDGLYMPIVLHVLHNGWRWKTCFFFIIICTIDIDQLVTINGMVIRSSQLIPEMQEAFFKCQICAFSTRVEIDRGRIAEPSVCKNCNTTHSMALIHNRSMFSDKQMVCCSL